jgi:hypothetical protein
MSTLMSAVMSAVDSDECSGEYGNCDVYRCSTPVQVTQGLYSPQCDWVRYSDQ